MHATENQYSLLKCEEVKSLTRTRNKKLLFNRAVECDFLLVFFFLLFIFPNFSLFNVPKESIGLYVCLYPETV